MAKVYTFQTVTVPGATGGTWLGGINNGGEVTGSYISADNPTYPKAFTDTNGTIGIIAVPSAGEHVANGINNLGQVAGAMGDAPVGVRGFLFSPSSDAPFQTIANPAATLTSGPIDQARGVNDSGEVVGIDYLNHAGFLWQNGRMSFIQVPGATSTEAHGVNNLGEIVGIAGNHGFADINGQFSTIDVPGAAQTDAAAVNLAGVIAGSYYDGAHWHGFVDTAGQIQTVDAPGAADTWVSGENDRGQLVGYSDTVPNGIRSGFIATDPPAPKGGGSFGHSAAGRPMFGVPLHMMHGHA